jgi:hypothetical protein
MHEDDQRLTRLRDLVDRLERLPESAHRDWMLAEVRARMVDVDTGFPPQPLRRRREAEQEPEQPPAATRPAKRPATVRPQPDARVEPHEAPPQQAPDAAGELTEDRRIDGDEVTPVPSDPDHVLWLEDSTDDAESPAESELPAWRRGLRG